MRRAIVMSVLFHLLVLASLTELPVWPTGAPLAATRSLPVVVGFRSVAETSQRNAALGNQPMAEDVSSVTSRTRMTMPASPVVVKRRAGKSASRVPGVGHWSAPVEVAENLAILPADLEREYRINLAREARRFQDYPAEIMAKGRAGLVRMSIAYSDRLGVPSVRLEKSSGYRELDQVALNTLAHAISRVPLPPGAQGISFRMPYVLEYRLADRED